MYPVFLVMDTLHQLKSHNIQSFRWWIPSISSSLIMYPVILVVNTLHHFQVWTRPFQLTRGAYHHEWQTPCGYIPVLTMTRNVWDPAPSVSKLLLFFLRKRGSCLERERRDLLKFRSLISFTIKPRSNMPLGKSSPHQTLPTFLLLLFSVFCIAIYWRFIYQRLTGTKWWVHVKCPGMILCHFCCDDTFFIIQKKYDQGSSFVFLYFWDFLWDLIWACARNVETIIKSSM